MSDTPIKRDASLRTDLCPVVLPNDGRIVSWAVAFPRPEHTKKEQ